MMCARSSGQSVPHTAHLCPDSINICLFISAGIEGLLGTRTPHGLEVSGHARLDGGSISPKTSLSNIFWAAKTSLKLLRQRASTVRQFLVPMASRREPEQPRNDEEDAYRRDDGTRRELEAVERFAREVVRRCHREGHQHQLGGEDASAEVVLD